MKKAFTLVELIVVITILAILGTIAFITFQTYTNDARDVIRTNDLGVINTSMELFQQNIGHYPEPDSFENVTYSGGLLWKQGVIGNKVFRQLGDISDILLDPKYLVNYPYSITKNANEYQISTIIEGDIAGNNLINKANAIDSGYFSNYIIGNYNGFTLTSVVGGTNCYIITVPDLNINNLPASNDLEDNGTYNFVYNEGYNLANQYLTNINTSGAGKVFNIKEVYNGCSLDSLSQLSNYILDLSDTFIQFNDLSKYEELIYNNDTKIFMIGIIKSLKKQGIDTGNLLSKVNDNNFFNDKFTGTDNLSLSDYSNDDGVWNGVGTGAYEILGNNLKKINTSSGFIYPDPYIPLTSGNTSTVFQIKNFGGDKINIYARYTDDNNYYKLELSETGYREISLVGGTETVIENITGTISVGSFVEFSVIGHDLHLIIKGLDKGTQSDLSISNIGITAIELVGNGAIIDNFSLVYE